VSVTVDKICELAFEHGLPTSVLKSIVDIVTRKTQLDQTSVTNLAKNLYPSQKIPSNIVVRIVCSLGQGAGKPSSSTQGALLRWLTIVHEIIEDPRILSKLYNVLFNHLDMISLRYVGNFQRQAIC
jgi:centromere protein I